MKSWNSTIVGLWRAQIVSDERINPWNHQAMCLQTWCHIKIPWTDTLRSRCGSLNQWDVMSFISVLIQPKPTVDGSELRLTTTWDVSQTLDKIILKKTSNLNMVETAGFRTNHQHLRVEMRSALNTALGLYFCMINTGTWRTQIITIWGFPKMVVPPKHPKMIILSRKTPWLLGTTILGNHHIDAHWSHGACGMFFFRWMF